MRQKRTTRKREGQPVLAGRQEFSEGMAVEGFTPGTRKAYGYAFDRFGKALKGKSAMAADVGDAKRYLAGLKQAGASRNVYGNALATLKFFFVKVRGLEWAPVSPLRRRMIEDMRLHGFSDRTQSSYVRAVLGLACHYPRTAIVIGLRSTAWPNRNLLHPKAWSASGLCMQPDTPLFAPSGYGRTRPDQRTDDALAATTPRSSRSNRSVTPAVP